jgi:hypothetical protein
MLKSRGFVQGQSPGQAAVGFQIQSYSPEIGKTVQGRAQQLASKPSVLIHRRNCHFSQLKNPIAVAFKRYRSDNLISQQCVQYGTAMANDFAFRIVENLPVDWFNAKIFFEPLEVKTCKRRAVPSGVIDYLELSFARHATL